MPDRAPNIPVEPRLQGSKTDSSPAPPPAVPSKLGVGCLGVVVPLVSGVLLLIPDVPSGSWVAIPPLTLGAYLVLAWATRRTSWSFFTSLGATLLAPLLYLRVRVVLGLSDAAVPFYNDGCNASLVFGDPDPISEWLSTTVLFIPIAVLGFFLARWIAWRARGPLSRLLHGASLSALIAGALLFACLLPRAFTAPDPEFYFANLPVLGVVPPPPGDPEPVTNPRESSRTDETSIADLVVSRTCWARSSCSIKARLLEKPKDRRADGRFRDMPGECYPPRSTFSVHDASLVVREDAAIGLVVIDEGRRVHALRRPGLFLTDVRLSELAHSASPPQGLMVTGAFGVGLALFLRLVRRRVARRLDRIATARAGVLDEAGWIEFEDGSAALRVGPEERLAPGPVVVLEGAPGREGGGPYRGGGRRASVEVIPGERAEILAREQRAQAPLDAHALAVVALAVAPLVAVAQVWLM